MNDLSIEIVVKYNSFLSAAEMWQKLKPMQSTLHGKDVFDEFTGKKVEAESLNNDVEKRKKNDFYYRIGEGSIYYNNPGNKNGHVGRVLIKNLATSVLEAEDWLSSFFSDDRFVMARIVDWEYETWQNNTDIASFERHGREHKNLSKKSNNLPPPLDKLIIDINANSGRRILRSEYMEAIGSTMWLGEVFWMLTGKSKSDVIGNTEFKVSEIGRSLKIKAQDTLFTKSDGVESIRQNSLRDLLFKN